MYVAFTSIDSLKWSYLFICQPAYSYMQSCRTSIITEVEALIDKKLIDLLAETTKKSRTTIHYLIKKKREEYKNLISREDAAYLLALDYGTDIYDDFGLPAGKAEELRSLVLKVPSVRVIREKPEGDEKQQAEREYLTIRKLPDDFYYGLLDSVNKSYTHGICVAVSVLVRKLLENLLVDILRKKFKMKSIGLFYDKRNRRFRGLNVLIKNFEDNLDSFKTVMPSIDSDFVKKLNTYREAGNSAAHTLEVETRKSDLDAKREALEFIVKALVRLYNNI